MKLITSKEMEWVDQTAIQKRKIPSLVLMENAGWEVAKVIESLFDGDSSPTPLRHGLRKNDNPLISIFCGKGNNGGDGLVIARHLYEAGFQVQVYLIGRADDYHGDPLINLNRLPFRYRLLLNDRNLQEFKKEIEKSSLLVDAIFGTGLDRSVRGFAAKLIRFLNQTKIPVVAVDIPSGLCATTGKVLGEAICAAMTVTFHLPKRGLVLGPAIDRVGELKVVKIGIPEDLIPPHFVGAHGRAPQLSRAFLITPDLFEKFFKPRKKISHKNDYGHVLTIAGSKRKIGAALMTARAALRSGAGLSTLALPDSAYQKIDPKFSEVMFEPQKEDGDFFSFDSLASLLKIAQKKSVVACGPGMGITEDLQKMVQELVCKIKIPLVLDADALNCLSLSKPSIPKKHATLVLTPHPGEFIRLLHQDKTQFLKNREEIAIRFARKHQLYLVLKGYRSWVITPEGDLYVNSTGNPGMATAGAGDVLTGIISGLIAQKIPIREAVLAGVWIHGRAGDLVAEERGERGIVAWDIAEKVPLAIREICLFSPSPLDGERVGVRGDSRV